MKVKMGKTENLQKQKGRNKWKRSRERGELIKPTVAGVEPRALPLVHVFIEHLLCVLQGETRKK